MSIARVLNKLNWTENLISVYRNYSSMNKTKKGLALIYSCVSSTIYLASFIHVNYYSKAKLDFNAFFFFCYNFLSTISAVSAILIGLRRSHHFERLQSNINAISEIYQNDSHYRNLLKKLNRQINYLIFGSVVLYFTVLFIYGAQIDDGIIQSTMFDQIVDCITQLIFILEQVVYCSYILLIYYSLEQMTWSVLAVVEAVDGGEGQVEMSEVGTEVDKVALSYEHLAESSAHLQACFGLQISFTVFMSSVLYIGLLYRSIMIFATQQATDDNGVSATVLLMMVVTYILLELVMVLAGQRAANQLHRLHRALARLYNTLLSRDDTRAVWAVSVAVRRLARLAAARAVLAGAAGGLRVRAALLPGVVAGVADYLVILLQFSHVV